MKTLNLMIESQELKDHSWEEDASYDLTLKNCKFETKDLPPNINNLHLIGCEKTNLDVKVNKAVTLEYYNIQSFETMKGMKAEKLNLTDCNILGFANLEDVDVKVLALDNFVTLYTEQDTVLPKNIKVIATTQHTHGFKKADNIEIVESVLHF